MDPTFDIFPCDLTEPILIPGDESLEEAMKRINGLDASGGNHSPHSENREAVLDRIIDVDEWADVT
jgi:hypothetical protein